MHIYTVLTGLQQIIITVLKDKVIKLNPSINGYRAGPQILFHVLFGHSSD